MPPVIRVAERTRDLSVVQDGTTAVLRWSYPSMTRDGGSLPDLEAVEVLRATIPAGQEPKGGGPRFRDLQAQVMNGRAERLALLEESGLAAATRGPDLVYRDDLRVWHKANMGKGPLVIWYAVRTICCGGRVSEYSNIARLVPQIPPAPPTSVEAKPGPDGIVLTWTPEKELPVLIERAEKGSSFQSVTASPVTPPWKDVTARQGTTWQYRLRSVAKAGTTEIIGSEAATVTVDYPDIYPPATPKNFICLPEEGSIRLRWSAVPGAAAYRVFRQKRGAKHWDHLEMAFHDLEYRDPSPPLGSLTYAVKAVDAAGNECGRPETAMNGRLLKVEGAGNDFLLGTGEWGERLAREPHLVARLCRRRRGIGADGALALFVEDTATLRLVYRNADGSEASFCANGTRCAARAGVELLGLPAGGLTILTGWGPIAAAVEGETVTLDLPAPETGPRVVELAAAGRRWTGWLLPVGVPHLVLPVEDLGALDLATVGPPLRAHGTLEPEGANVNFVEGRGRGAVAVRSFERGVEAETLSCGSGVVAAALCWMAEAGITRLRCATRSGDDLLVEALGDPPRCPTRLRGPARFIAEIDPVVSGSRP